MTGIRIRSIAAGFFIAIGLAPVAAVQAGTVAGTGGSTEITQLMNNVELVKTSVDTAENVRNTLQSALYLKQSLQQLDPSAIAQMMGVPLEQVQAMATIHDQLSGLISAEQDVSSRIQGFTQYSQASHMSPSEYLGAISQLAQTRGGIYKKYMDANQASAQNVNERIRSIQQTAESAPGITSQVSGLSKLLVANTQVQTQLVGLEQTMGRANDIALLQAKDQNAAVEDQSAKSTAEKASFDNLKNAHIELPDPSQFAPGN